MLYKIIPFLVWFGRYSQHIGRAKVPALADLYSPQLQAAGYWSWVAGLIVVCTAIVLTSEIGVRIGSILLAVSLGTLMFNVGTMFSHFIRPRLEELSFAPNFSPIPAPTAP